MTPLDQLDAGWKWYENARDSLRRLRRLADQYWAVLPWEGDVKMWRDNLIGKLEGEEVLKDAANAESRLDDLAVIELFSIFEGAVRTLVADQVREASLSLTRPVLKAAAKGAIEAAKRRSFADILRSYSQGGHAGIAEQVRQVRKYRNWVSHGRRPDTAEPKIDPKTAYQRLRKFLELLLPPPTAPAAEEPTEAPPS